MDPGKVYIVPTPIGNLKDITFRAVEVLTAVDRILAEDTRTTGILLKHYGVDTPLSSFHAFNEHQRLTAIIEDVNRGDSLALVSDAGTPGISDPGFLLTRAVVQAKLPLEVLPGATAFVPALLKSGFPCDRFVFEGFLPHKKGRQTRLKRLVEEDRTIVFYESPHRLLKLLEQLEEHFPGREVSVSRELTKLHEETVNGTPMSLRDYFQEKAPKGEIVVVLKGKEKNR